jgi:hypothetical protein
VYVVSGMKEAPPAFKEALKQNETILPLYVEAVRKLYEGADSVAKPKAGGSGGAKPGDNVSPGGIIIPPGARTT